MDEGNAETDGPKHHSFRPNLLTLLIIGVVGGAALYFGVMAWYFKDVDPIGRHSGHKDSASKSSATDVGNGGIALETGVFDIVPLSDLHVKIVNGVAESVETPKDSGLTATLEGNSVKVSATKDAKAGAHQITVHDAKGKQATLSVNVKR